MKHLNFLKAQRLLYIAVGMFLAMSICVSFLSVQASATSDFDEAYSEWDEIQVRYNY